LRAEVTFCAKKQSWPTLEEHHTGKDIFKIVIDAIPALMTPIIILGGIYSGLLTPTESSVVACLWALIAGMFFYRELRFKDLINIFYDSAKSSAMILFIISASTAFSWVFTYSGLSSSLVDTVTGMNLNRTLFCLLVAIILLIFGTFMEGTAICVLLVPVLWPIALSLNISPLHFGMIVCVSNVIGTMTPPVAVNIFSATSVSKLPMGDIAKAEIPFLFGYCAVFFLTVFFPWFSTCFA
ncbi:MAG: TRAP transporter large permease, partial [Lawsonibacter sp.]|nr:TRAP transporter large permease [Lawsonibacter sp.]